MKKFTLALSALMMLGATAVAQETETPVAKKLICTANFDAAAQQKGFPRYLGATTDGTLAMTNTIDDLILWTVSEPAEDGAVKVQNVELEDYLYENNNGLRLSADPVDAYFVVSPEIPYAFGITTTKDASTSQHVFLNIDGSTGAIATWKLDRGSSFYIIDYVEGDTDETIQARVQSMVERSDKINAFKKYCDASTYGTNNKESFVKDLENATEETFPGLLADLTDAVMGYAISDLEAIATIKTQNDGLYVHYSADTTDKLKLTQTFDLANDLWQATDLNGIMGMSVTGATCRFKIKNASNGLYIADQSQNNTAIQVTDNAEQAAIFAIVAGASGLELKITNNADVENNFVNAQLSTNTVVTWQVANDANAYWVFNTLETVAPTTTGVEFTGEFTDLGWGIKEYSTITGFSINVPKGAALTGTGSINVYRQGSVENTPIYAKTVAEALAGITPTEGSKTYTVMEEDGTVNEWGIPNWREVEKTAYFDVYTITFDETYTEPGSWVIEVSPYAFSVQTTEGETTTTQYTPELRQVSDIPTPTFEITVAPAEGTVDEIADITLTATVDDDNNPETPATPIAFDINPTVEEGVKVTLVREWSEPMVDENGQPVIFPEMGQIMETKYETVLSLDSEAIMAFFSYNDEDPTSPVFTIPANASATGSYNFIIPEGFFADDNGALNKVVSANWTIEVKDGIKTVSNVRVEGNAIFDLQGRKVSKASKGVFIINGKKVLVK